MAPAITCICGECRKCIRRIRQRDRYREPGVAERIREQARASRLRRIEAVRAYDRARGFREKDPLKVKARNATRALGKGQHPCEICGSKPADAHHEDYDKPLEVQWLCEEHHYELHRRVA